MVLSGTLSLLSFVTPDTCILQVSVLFLFLSNNTVGSVNWDNIRVVSTLSEHRMAVVSYYHHHYIIVLFGATRAPVSAAGEALREQTEGSTRPERGQVIKLDQESPSSPLPPVPRCPCGPRRLHDLILLLLCFSGRLSTSALTPLHCALLPIL